MKFSFKKANWKDLVPHIVALSAFILFSVLYCRPVFQGKVLQAGDVNTYLGAAHETHEYMAKEGRQIWWTGSMFGGMPTYQISASSPANVFRAKLERVAHLGFYGDKDPVGLLLGYLIGFYLMLLCFGVNRWLSIAGAFALALSSYFLLIIPAGHITKAVGLGFLAPIIGGCYAIYRKRFRIGVPLVLIYGIVGITMHPQMTYYIFMLIGVLIIGEIYDAVKNKEFKRFEVSTAVFAACLLCVFATKYSWFSMNNQYLAETMRGGHSELTATDANSDKVKDKSANKGLDFDYATAWSYGKDETLTLLIPGFMGGSSCYDLGKNSRLEKDLKKLGVPSSQARQICQGAPIYRGEKPFTSGPVYAGAIMCFLFILGLIIVPGYKKWVLLAATAFSITLAWGHNFEGWSRLFFNWFPMYNKFRAVESILVVAEITIPLLGLLGLGQILKEDRKKVRKSIFISAGITGGICLITAICSNMIDVRSSYDAEWAQNMDFSIYRAVLDQRAALISSSAWRSLIFVLIGAGIVLIFNWKRDAKNSALIFASALTVAVFADMIPVGRQYFGKQDFVTQKTNNAAFEMQPWESLILKDDDPNFRVMNLSTDTFNESRTSYRFKSIGGYSAVKLRRYQDLIDRHISKGNMNVLNMLNTKYFITGDGTVQKNEQAFGNAWFVDNVIFTDTPEAECNALNEINLRTTAVADKKFSGQLQVPAGQASEADHIVLDKYIPDCLEYTSVSSNDRVAVFSEVYYPQDWHLYIDGKEQAISRVDYTLRAAVIPAGTHTLKMEFIPEGLKIDNICFAIIILSLIASAVLVFLPCFVECTPRE